MTKRRLTAVLLVLAMAASVAGTAVPAEESSAGAKKKEYIIQMDSGADYQEMDAKMKKKDRRVVRHNEEDEAYLEENKAMVVSLTESEAAELEGEGGITVEEDATVTGSGETEDPGLIVAEPEVIDMDALPVEDEYTTDAREFVPRKAVNNKKDWDEVVPWNISCVAGTPHDNKYKGKKVKVAVLDSGIDMHDDLATTDWVDFSDTVNGYKPVDNNGHGTSVAGPVAARISGFGMEGIASEAELYSVKVLNEDNTASVSTIVKAIEWCVQNDMDIINMSFGMDSYSEILADAVRKAYNNDILMVAAAGNDGKGIQYPAGFPEVLSVGSVDSELKASEFSDNSQTDLAAPGEDAQTTGFLGSYSKASGTSIAAAHVTGVAAAVKSANKKLTAEQLAGILTQTAIPLGEDGKLVNYENAVNLATDKKAAADVTREEVAAVAAEKAADEECYVKGNWSPANWRETGIGHQTIVKDIPLSYFYGSSTTEQTKYRDITAEAVWLTDKLKYMSAIDDGNYERDGNGNIISGSSKKSYSPYHAKSEYTLSKVKQHLLFLYELARRRIILGGVFSTNATKYGNDEYAGVEIDTHTQRRIVVDFSKMRKVNTLMDKTSLVSDSVKADGYMILGSFLHLVQDMQAHRAKITINMIMDSDGNYHKSDTFVASASESHIDTRNVKGGSYLMGLKMLIANPGMPMIRLKDSLIDTPKKDPSKRIIININNVIYECTAGQAYEDNPYFYSDRFTAAETLSKYYLNYMKTDSANTTTLNNYYVSNKVNLV